MPSNLGSSGFMVGSSSCAHALCHQYRYKIIKRQRINFNDSHLNLYYIHDITTNLTILWIYSNRSCDIYWWSTKLLFLSFFVFCFFFKSTINDSDSKLVRLYWNEWNGIAEDHHVYWPHGDLSSLNKCNSYFVLGTKKWTKFKWDEQNEQAHELILVGDKSICGPFWNKTD